MKFINKHNLFYNVEESGKLSVIYVKDDELFLDGVTTKLSPSECLSSSRTVEYINNREGDTVDTISTIIYAGKEYTPIMFTAYDNYEGVYYDNYYKAQNIERLSNSEWKGLVSTFLTEAKLENIIEENYDRLLVMDDVADNDFEA